MSAVFINNIDEIVPSIMMKIGIKCSFVSLLFFFQGASTLLLKMLFHSVWFPN